MTKESLAQAIALSEDAASRLRAEVAAHGASQRADELAAELEALDAQRNKYLVEWLRAGLGQAN